MTETVEQAAPLPTARSHAFDPPDGLRPLQRHRPISRLAYPDGSVGWLVTRLSTARTVLTDPRFSARQDLKRMPVAAGIGDEQMRPPSPGMFVSMDPPDHTRYRRLLAGQFTAKRMRQLGPRIEQVVRERLEAMERLGPVVDLVQVWAFPIPQLVICEILGVPFAERERFQHDTEIIVTLDSTAQQVAEAHARVGMFMQELITAKRARPTDDLLSGLAIGGQLTDEELTTIASLLLFAGFETTAQMLALGVFALLQHPTQAQALRDDDALVDNAVEELMRYLSVIQFGLVRAATEDLELDGVQIRAGEVVTCSVPMVNRDPAQFPDPDVLDLHRSATGHIGFGYGLHQCLGAQLARMEMRTAYPKLLRRFPTLRLAVPVDQVPMRDGMTVYGVHSLPVTWGPH
ncbi:cytochrome P450 [Actinomycetes bacterium KLBMP 9797]